MTSCPMRFESHVWPTPITPVTIGIPTMPATRKSSSPVSMSVPLAKTLSSSSRSRKAGIIEMPAVTAIRPSSSPRLRR